MGCPPKDDLLAFVEDRGNDESNALIRSHLHTCSHCRAIALSLMDDSERLQSRIVQDDDVAGPVISDDREAPSNPFEDTLDQSSYGDQIKQARPLNIRSAPPNWSALKRASSQLLEADRTVDHFRVMRLLGRGGMGEVYLARDLQLGRKVALKVINPELLGSAKAVSRFLFEARTTARFNHPHIVTVYAVGKVGEMPYVALEYLEGQDLRERIRDDRPSIPEALRFALAIAEAISEAHSHGILHRDLKPANVIIPNDGRVRVVDFGLAKQLDSEQDQHETGAVRFTNLHATDKDGVRGTPAYMSPEQWQKGEATTASDIWALGLVAYELITGKRPYMATSLKQLKEMVVESAPVPLDDERLVELSVEGIQILSDCCQKEPQHRPSAAQVVERLRDVLNEGRRSIGSEESPYRGLLPFTERHAVVFFGREAEINACVERLRQEPILAVVGPSGAGKSSFVQAGVVPRLREQGQWIVLRVRPGDSPAHRLASHIISALDAEVGSQTLGSSQYDSDTAPRSGESTSQGAFRQERIRVLAESLIDSPHQLALELLSLARVRERRVLLLVDQVEELFTVSNDSAEAQAIAQAICLAADDPMDPVRVVLTVRDDFLGQLAAGGESVRQSLRNVTVLNRLKTEDLREIIIRPLFEVGYRFDDETLVDEMIGSVDPLVGLPLLQFTARSLWDSRDRVKRILKRSDYDAMNGLEGALARHADDVLAGLSAHDLNIVRAILLRMVTPERTRRTISMDQALDGLGDEAQDILERLTTSRLVTIGRGDVTHNDSTCLELAHESLVHRWQTLARWIDESRDDISFLLEAEQASQLWVQRGRRPSEVWQGDALRDALKFTERREAPLPGDIRAFLDAGQRLEVVRHRRRQILSFGVPIILAVIATVLGLQKQEADFQRDEAQSQRIEALREGAVAALQRNNILASRAKLRTALESGTEVADLTRALWWRLSHEPLNWQRDFGGYVGVLDYSPDGNNIAVATMSGGITVLDALTSRTRILRGRSRQVTALVYGVHSRRLFAGDWDGFVTVWNTDSGQPITRFKAHERPIYGIAHDPDTNRLYTGSPDEKLKAWNPENGESLGRFDTQGSRIWSIAISADGQRLLSAHSDGATRVWNPKTLQKLHTLEGHKGVVNMVAIHPKGHQGFSVGSDGTARIWDLESGRQVSRLGDGRNRYESVDMSPDGRFLAVGSNLGSVTIWDVSNGRIVDQWVNYDKTAFGVSFSPDSKVVVSSEGTEVLSRKMGIQSLTSNRERPTDPIYGIDMSPDGQMIATAGGPSIFLWSVASGLPIERLPPDGLNKVAVAFVGDGRRLVYSTEDGKVRTWDLKNHRYGPTFNGHGGKVYALTISSDYRLLATSSTDRTIKIWALDSGELKKTLRGHSRDVQDVKFSRDNRQLITASMDYYVKVWDVDTGEVQHSKKAHELPVHTIAVHPTESIIASSGWDGWVHVWRLDGLEKLKSVQPGKPGSRAIGLDFSPNGKSLAIATSDGSAYLWSLDETAPKPLVGHRGELNLIRFHPTGRSIITSSDDKTVRFWTAQQRTQRWFGRTIISGQRWLLTHRGWDYIDGAPSGREPGSTKWGRAAQTSRHIDVSSGVACIVARHGGFQVWDTEKDTSSEEVSVRSINAVRATEKGCLVWGDGHAQFYNRSGEKTVLPSSGILRAIGATNNRIFVATDRYLTGFNTDNQVVERYIIEPGVRAINTLVKTAVLPRQLILGFSDGGVELRSVLRDGLEASLKLQQTPSSPARRIVPGPAGTIAIGFADGMMGIWSRRTGQRIVSTRLHGAIHDIEFTAKDLIVLSELGDVLRWDVSSLNAPACDVLRSMWADVSVVWRDGQAQIQPPPKTHICALTANGSPE